MLSSNNKQKVLVVDLDGTLCTQGKTGTYQSQLPFQDMIRQVNAFWTEGWRVVIFTARGMETCNGDLEKIESEYRQLTEDWLADNRVLYDELKFGKPAADIYVDDKGMHPHTFRCMKDIKRGWEK